MPRIFLRNLTKASDGINSSKAKLLSYSSMIRVSGGSVMVHICMNIKNYSRFMMFQRYLRPMARKTWRIIKPIEKPAIVDSTSPLIYSRTSMSAWLIYGCMLCCSCMICWSWVPSSTSMKTYPCLNSITRSSGSMTL